MALETKCLTPDAMFHTSIGTKYISTRITLPFELRIDEKEAKTLEKLNEYKVSSRLNYIY